MIDLDVKGEFTHSIDRLRAFPKMLVSVVRKLASDVSKRSPGIIGAAVQERYAVSKLTAVKTLKPGTEKRWSDRGNTTIKAHMGYSSLWGLEALLTVTGGVFSDWPTQANGGNKVPMETVRKTKTRPAYKKRIPYVVTRQVLKDQWMEMRPKREGVRVFVLPRKNEKATGTHKLRAYVAKKGKRGFKPLGGTSIPQAIAQEKTVSIWQPKLHDMYRKRIDHFLDLALGGGMDENGRIIKK